MRRDVKTQQREMRLMNLIKAGLGAPTLSGPDSNQATVVDNGVGDYSIVPAEPFGNTPICIPQSKTSAVMCRIGTVTATSIQILCFAQADGTTPAEGDFDVMIMGSEIADKY